MLFYVIVGYFQHAPDTNSGREWNSEEAWLFLLGPW